MNYSKESESEAQNECDVANYTSALNKLNGTSDSFSTQDDVKIKVEIELKEAENDLVFQPDFYGHLRLVNVNQISSDTSSDVKNKDVRSWSYFQDSLSTSGVSEDIIVPTEESNLINVQRAYEQLNNIYSLGLTKDKSDSSVESFQGSVFSSSLLYSNLQKDLYKQEFSKSTTDNYTTKKRELSSVLAEKKRNYRNKIKEENPAMWCAMKQKEACKKREQREEKRFILLEMQKMMHLLSLPESPETEKHKEYLGTLKERYPDIWKQLLDALSSAEQRQNSDLLEGIHSTKKRSKPTRAYKDIVEAQKKYLYRQRMKLERPDLYEQQKARDSYARSIRRMLKKQFSESQNNNTNCDINNIDISMNSEVNVNSNVNNNDDCNLNEVHGDAINS